MNPRATDPLAQALPQLLARRGWSMRQLAGELGMNVSHLSRALDGSKRLSLERIREISALLEVPADYFAEAREAAIVEAIGADPALRDALYDWMRRRTTRAAR